MSTHEDDLDLAVDDNVLTFRPREPAVARLAELPPSQDDVPTDMRRYPVDIHGHVTFGRLLSGLATVGLTVRVDARSGRVVIADELYG